jgi:hypothetical protein
MKSTINHVMLNLQVQPYVMLILTFDTKYFLGGHLQVKVEFLSCIGLKKFVDA